MLLDPQRVGCLGSPGRQNFAFLTLSCWLHNSASAQIKRKDWLSGVMLTSALLKSQRDGVKGKEISLLEAGGEWGLQLAGSRAFHCVGLLLFLPSEPLPGAENPNNCLETWYLYRFWSWAGTFGESDGDDIEEWRWRAPHWQAQTVLSQSGCLHTWLIQEALQMQIPVSSLWLLGI